MSTLRRNVTAVATSTLILTGSAVFAFPGIAAADTITTPCGSSITAEAGDKVVGQLAVLAGTLPVNLGTVTESTTLTSTVQGLLCSVEVTVEDIVEEGKKVVDDAVGTVKDTADTAKETVENVTGAVEDVLQPKPDDPAPGTPPGDGGDPGKGGNDGDPQGVPDSTSPVFNIPGFNAPFRYGGFDAIGSFSSLPYSSFNFDSAPGLRYGDFADYNPEFGLLGQDGSGDGRESVQNAGQAQQIGDPKFSEGVTLPVLLAVLALAGASAGLVRTWVIRAATQ